MSRICELCKKTFTPNFHTRIYCGDECSRLAQLTHQELRRAQIKARLVARKAELRTQNG